jgi:WD40 repeat protein
VRLWDTVTGAVLQTLKGHLYSVNSVAFSLDGKQIVSGSDDGTVRLWDAATGAALQTLEGHWCSVSSVAFSPDGKQVVSGSHDGTMRLWDAATGAALQKRSVSSVAFLPDGNIAKGLFVLQDWIMEGTVELLWLPPDYRATCVAFWNRVMVLGHSSGRVSILAFKEGSSHMYSTT